MRPITAAAAVTASALPLMRANRASADLREPSAVLAYRQSNGAAVARECLRPAATADDNGPLHVGNEGAARAQSWLPFGLRVRS